MSEDITNVCPECEQRFDSNVTKCFICGVDVVVEVASKSSAKSEPSFSGSGKRQTTMDFDREHFFNERKPMITYLIMASCIFIYVIMGINGLDPGKVQEYNEGLIKLGGNHLQYTLLEPWRLISYAFLHGGFLHLAMNMWCIYVLGVLTEKIYGHTTYAFIFILCSIGGGLGSLISNLSQPVVSVGASGGVFGIMGALMFFFIVHKKIIDPNIYKRIVPQLIFFLILNVVLGLSVSGIDNGAHMGGFITGAIMASIMRNGQHIKIPLSIKKLLAIVIVSILSILVFMQLKSKYHGSYTDIKILTNLILSNENNIQKFHVYYKDTGMPALENIRSNIKGFDKIDNDDFLPLINRFKDHYKEILKKLEENKNEPESLGIYKLKSELSILRSNDKLIDELSTLNINTSLVKELLQAHENVNIIIAIINNSEKDMVDMLNRGMEQQFIIKRLKEREKALTFIHGNELDDFIGELKKHNKSIISSLENDFSNISKNPIEKNKEIWDLPEITRNTFTDYAKKYGIGITWE